MKAEEEGRGREVANAKRRDERGGNKEKEGIFQAVRIHLFC
jgi:hypothetical protein